MLRLLVLSILIICGLQACEDPVYTPKPRMFPRIDYPARDYRTFSKADCPFTFEYPAYAQVTQEDYIFDDGYSNACWFNLSIPAFNGTLYTSYIPVESETGFNKVIRDAFKIVGKHNIKANYREEAVIQNAQGVTGLAFNIKGPVATPYQYYVTDTTQHFFRASLYFNTQVAPDSMAPIYRYVIEDVQHMIDTWEWR